MLEPWKEDHTHGVPTAKPILLVSPFTLMAFCYSLWTEKASGSILSGVKHFVKAGGEPGFQMILHKVSFRKRGTREV